MRSLRCSAAPSIWAADPPNLLAGPPAPPTMSGFTAPHCGSLRATDVGREVELYGWVARRRDHGGLIFIDLRDRWGPVQVVFKGQDTRILAAGLRLEFVVRIKGIVEGRPA